MVYCFIGEPLKPILAPARGEASIANNFAAR
jgi:hypothetical protein